jgi:hypothetical protein
MDGSAGGGGGGGGGGSSITGNVNGRPTIVLSAAAQRLTVSDGVGGSRPGLAIRLSEHTAVCNPNGTLGLGASDKRLATLYIFGPSGSAPVDVGEHEAELKIEVPDCTWDEGLLGPVERSPSVSVTITSVSGRVVGTFSGTLLSGAPISGVFDAEFCSFYNSSSFVKCD